MKKLLQYISVILASTFIVCSFAGCGGSSDQPLDSSVSGSSGEEITSAGGGTGAELAVLVNPGSSIDDKSFVQGTWEGAKAYAEEHGISYQNYKVSDNSEDSFLSCIELAVSGGAKVIFCPGFNFAKPVGKAQEQYPDTKFVLMDVAPVNAEGKEYVAENTYAAVFAENEAGFLAGYAAVKDGYRKLGFLGGMAQPAVVRFGYGFVQGADYAADELGLAPGEVEVLFSYTGNWDANPENQSKAASWYQSGTEVIFACGGALGQSVFAAAEANGAKAIGVDVDQSDDSETVITSAIKDLSVTAYNVLEQFYAGSFPGGVAETRGVYSGSVGLPMDNSRFSTFSTKDYQEIYSKMEAGEESLGVAVVNDSDYSSADQVPTTIATVKTVE